MENTAACWLYNWRIFMNTYESVDFPTMSDREKYLFDLQGFLVIKNILSPDDLRALNDAVDANLDIRREDGNRGTLPRFTRPSQGNPLFQHPDGSRLEIGSQSVHLHRRCRYRRSISSRIGKRYIQRFAILRLPQRPHAVRSHQLKPINKSSTTCQ